MSEREPLPSDLRRPDARKIVDLIQRAIREENGYEFDRLYREIKSRGIKLSRPTYWKVQRFKKGR